MEIPATQIVFATLGVLGAFSMLRALLFYIRAKRETSQWIKLLGANDIGAFVAFSFGLVDLFFASLMFTEQSTHLFVVGCIVLSICILRTIFGTKYLLVEK